MADKIDLSPSELSAIENGRTSMTADIWKRIKDVYDLEEESPGELPYSIGDDLW